jgi:hypothetical protein
MALFGTLNVAGPANRQGTIQSLAPKAAQAVLRRQRLKALLSQAAATTGAGAVRGGPGTPIHSSMRGHAVGTRGATMRPDITADQLAEMARSAGRAGHLPGGIGGGVFGQGGGGFDFGALPAPADHSQAQASIGPSPFHRTPLAPAPPANPVAPNGDGGGSPPVPEGGSPSGAGNPGTFTPDAYFSGINTTLPQNVHGWVPLGGGLFYDPVNDIVRGGSSGNGLVGPDAKF